MSRENYINGNREKAFPKISIITPSFNQIKYIEKTINSVLDQQYPNIEYIIIDGGSTDGSVDMIRKYENDLTYWISEPDHGQTDAINKGFKRATGDWISWQNSDDVYSPGVFADLAKSVASNPKVDLIIGNMMLIDSADRELRDIHYVRPTYRALLAEGMVLTNQSAFWRRSVHEDIGWLDESLHYTFDYEWFLRLLRGRRAVHVNKMWGGYRLHEETKTSNFSEKFLEEKASVLRGRELSLISVLFYRMRRIFLMLAQGDFSYFFRGLIRRLRGKGGDLY